MLKKNIQSKFLIKGYVYLITNTENKKKYIGSKLGSPEKTKSYYGSGVALKHAIAKYGLKNFDKVILETYTTEKDMQIGEEKHLKKVDAAKNDEYYNMKNSYNGQLGYSPTEDTINKWRSSNDGNWYWSTHKISEEHRKKFSLAKQGIKQTAEHIASRMRYGNDHHNYGVCMSSEQKSLIANTKTKNSLNDGSKGFAFKRATGKYQARKRVNGELISLGTYSSAWVAHLFYLHGCWEFFLTGKICKWRALKSKARPQKNYILDEINRRLNLQNH